MTAELAAAVAAHCALIAPLSETDLERPWAWRAYDDEGVRFSCFRVLEELRMLAVHIADGRARAGTLPSQAQRILARYHVAFRELEGLLLLVGDDLAAWPPGAGQWPLPAVLSHITSAAAGFFAVISDAQRRHRAGEPGPVRFDGTALTAFYGEDLARFTDLERAPLSAVLAALRGLHGRVVDGLSGITDAELAVPSIWWEGEPMPARFRLHRFESHLRQHMIQAERTLEAVAGAPSEARRLARMLLAALGDAEGAALGAPDQSAAGETAAAIRDLTAGVRAALYG